MVKRYRLEEADDAAMARQENGAGLTDSKAQRADSEGWRVGTRVWRTRKGSERQRQRRDAGETDAAAAIITESAAAIHACNPKRLLLFLFSPVNCLQEKGESSSKS